MSEFVVKSSQCIHQGDLHRHIQMIAIPVKMLVRLLRNNEIQIARRHTRFLVGHTLERNRLSGVHSLLNIDRQLYLLRRRLTVRALSAIRPPHLPLGDAPFVALLDLLNEARGDLLHAHLDARSLTLLVVSHAFLPIDAEGLSDVFHLDDIAEVQLFHRYAEGHVDVGSGLLPLTPPASAKPAEPEVAEDIVESAVSSALSLPLFVLLQPLFAVTIVDLLLLLVGEDLVGVGDFGKLIGGALLLVFVRVVFERFGAVGLFDFLLGGRAFYAEEFVKVLCCVDGGEGEECEEELQTGREA
mmetsp:Transcript_34315/g.72277  ORF Transcript_34315/g.72277 Transcript_34315/m.72277 type:complete len:299 (+) Transcript_34315:447-1343(+)